MLICGIGFIYYAFYCSPSIVIYWCSLLVVLFFFVIYWCWQRYSPRLDAPQLTPRDRFPEFSFSLSSYVTIASFLPVGVAWLSQPEHFSNETLYYVLIEATICPLLVSIGVVVFAQGGFPERLLRLSVFDMVGHSHQIWHAITALVMFMLMSNTLKYFHARAEHQC